MKMHENLLKKGVDKNIVKDYTSGKEIVINELE